MKKKGVTGVLALLFGIWGVHRFYLGQRFKGFLMLALFGICMIATLEENAPFIMIPAILGFIDAILFFVMPQEDFDDRFNRKAAISRQPARRPSSVNYRKSRRDNNYTVKYPNPHKIAGLAKYKDYDYEGAITDFKKALDVQYDDPAVHFNLACCYSIMEKADNSFFHLEKAVEFGFDDFDRIHHHDALAYIRTSNEFDAFAENRYRKISKIEAPKEDLLNTPMPLMDKEVLDKIASLGELRDKGFLTEEEFNLQKKRLLEMR